MPGAVKGPCRHGISSKGQMSQGCMPTPVAKKPGHLHRWYRNPTTGRRGPKKTCKKSVPAAVPCEIGSVQERQGIQCPGPSPHRGVNSTMDAGTWPWRKAWQWHVKRPAAHGKFSHVPKPEQISQGPLFHIAVMIRRFVPAANPA